MSAFSIFAFLSEKSSKWSKKAVREVGPGLLIALAIEIIIFWSLSPHFLTFSNMTNGIGRGMTVIGIMAIGETIVIIAGGFDLSVGSVSAAAAIAAASLSNAGFPLIVAVLGALGVGLGVGIINGAITGYGRINPLITTLGTLAIVRGGGQLVTGGREKILHDRSFLDMGVDTTLAIPNIVWILFACFAILGFIIPRYRFGRYMYAIGSNDRASRLAGVRVNRWRLVFFGVSGMLAGLAGVVTAFRLGTAAPNFNTGSELAVITAVILGGASLGGGRGRLLGTFFGLIFIQILRNGLVLLSIRSFWQQIAIGTSLLVAVLYDEWRRSRLRSG
jgi:ribose/xylose/arabinose/galactoside ABC-type transport system permease subunit